MCSPFPHPEERSPSPIGNKKEMMRRLNFFMMCHAEARSVPLRKCVTVVMTVRLGLIFVTCGTKCPICAEIHAGNLACEWNAACYAVIMKLNYYATAILLLVSYNAHALPAFGIREKMSCTVCHTNGSAPHLTEAGYMYRRAGFRFIDRLGDRAADDQAMRLTEHFAVGTNVDYEVATSQGMNFNVPEVELWPIVGSFLGNYAAWTEVDAAVNTTTASGRSTGGINLSQADLRFASGNQNFFINARGGMLTLEGYGASDQGIDDGNIPLFDQLSAQFNQDTLVLPLGANNTPQLGAELGVNMRDTHFTLGVYNGFSGTNGLSTLTQSSLSAGITNQPGRNTKDYKLQVDQFVGSRLALTAIYYNGRIPLLDPTNSLVWYDRFNASRLYATWSVAPNQVDILGGAAYGHHSYVNPGSTTIVGTFPTRGIFLGANYYVMPHLTLSGRVDYDQLNYSTVQPVKANGGSLMVSLPYEYNIFVFHYSSTASDVSGVANDFRAEWRFLL